MYVCMYISSLDVTRISPFCCKLEHYFYQNLPKPAIKYLYIPSYLNVGK